jgi:hypothetical protein
MTKTIGVVVAAVMVLSAAGVALAADPPTTRRPQASERMRSFQKETLSLRDELAAKRVELDAEYDGAEPDPARIAQLRNEMADLRTRIQAAAEKHGWSRGHDRGTMMQRGGDWDGWGCGSGCGCW